jgi:hypothetical protein
VASGERGRDHHRDVGQHGEPPALDECHPQLQIGDDERGRGQRFGNEDPAQRAAQSLALGHSADLEPAG